MQDSFQKWNAPSLNHPLGSLLPPVNLLLLAVYTGTFHWCSPPKKNAQCLECCVKGVMLTHASVSTLLLSVWCWTAMRGMVWVAAFSVLSKSISRRRADFFFGAACFFFPVGPRCGLRAGPLSLSVFHKLVNNNNKKNKWKSTHCSHKSLWRLKSRRRLERSGLLPVCLRPNVVQRLTNAGLFMLSLFSQRFF